MKKLPLDEIAQEETRCAQQTKSQAPRETRYVKRVILIATEGRETEPNYFKALAETLKAKRFIIKVAVEGKGKSTSNLVEKVHRQVVYNNQCYDSVWVVFDKDSFDDFDVAIEQAGKYGFKCAWSNESFELWLLLHFKDVNKSTGRKDLSKLLENAIRGRMRENNPAAQYGYVKGDDKIYEYVSDLGNEDEAIKRAMRLKKVFENKAIPPSKQNPCTYVDELVFELRHPERMKFASLDGAL